MNVFRVRAPMPGFARTALALLPFLLLLVGYLRMSAARLAENPRDKLTPGPAQIAKGWDDVWKLRTEGYVEYKTAPGDTLASVAARRSGSAAFAAEIRGADGALPDGYVPRPGDILRVPRTERRIVVDTISSLKRLGAGVGVAVVVSVVLGILMGAFTPVESLLLHFVGGLAKLPPLAVLPIIFIFQGAGESAKITIIALGIAPTMILDIVQRVREVPQELVTKAYTLGASTFEVVLRVLAPIAWPSVLTSIRLALGPAWVYLIASEAISADSGLGYRIFIVQRQLGMNIILIYVLWIMTLGLAFDALLRGWIAWRCKWAAQP